MDASRGSTTRAAVGAGVLALHLLALRAFVVAARMQMPHAAAEPVMTWLSLPGAARRADVHVAPRPTVPPVPSPRREGPPPRERDEPVPAPIVAVSPAVPRPTAITPEAAPVRDKPVDWMAAAVDAARHHLDDQSAAQRRDRSMGSAPPSTARATPPHAAFPWGHQPLSKHVDRQGAIVTLNTRHCTVGLLLFIPFGFGCAPGSIPEPGRGDLFDPKYAPQPLELPPPLVDDPLRASPPPSRD